MSPGDYQCIRLEVADGVAMITLDRPDSLNAWIPELGHELLDATRSLRDDPEVRAIGITGAGRAFSSGADLKAERKLTADGNPDMGSGLREIYNPIIETVTATPKPYMASVNGAAAGIGCSLALACDLVVAAESAFFMLAFSRVGLVPDGGSLAHVAARAGFTRAVEMGLLAKRVPAATAAEWGLINTVVPDDRLAAETGELLGELAAGPTLAYGGIKRLSRLGALAGLVEQMELEAAMQQDQGATEDYREGVAAFTEKRPAEFKGR